MKKHALMVILPVLIGLACAAPAPGGVGTGEEVKARVEEGGAGFQCEPEKEHWRSAGPPRRGGTLTRSGTAAANLDPIAPGPRKSAPSQVYQALFQPRSCFFGDTTVVPVLAQGWEVTSDGLTWTIKLRDDVKWHNKAPVNGRPFTSADVAFTIGIQLAGGQLKSFWEGVSHQTPDASTIILRLSEPDSEFLQKLGYFDNVIVPKEIHERDGDFSKVAVGTGPFMVKEGGLKPEVEEFTTRNPDYYEKGDDGKPLPYVDEVHSLEFKDYVAEVAAFTAGLLDHTGTFGLLKPEADAYRRANPKAPGFEELQFTHAGIWFNYTKTPWKDVRVRKAISLALVRDDLIASNQGGAVIAGFVPSALPEWTWPEAKKRERFKEDKELAKKLLTEAGYPPGSLNVQLKTSGQYAQDAEVAQQHLAAVGINTRIEVDGRSFSVILQGYDLEDLAWGVIGGQPLLSYWVYDLVESRSRLNILKFSDARTDTLAAAQKREMDPTKRKQIIEELQEHLVEMMPYVPTVSRVYYHFSSCRLKNWQPSKPNHNHYGIKVEWLDRAGC